MDCWSCERPVTWRAEICDGCGASLTMDLDVDAAVPGLTGASVQQVQRRAAHTLLLIAILQAVFGSLMAVAMGPDLADAALVYVLFVAAIFFGLHLWARRNPVPAAWTGLLLFVGFHLLDAIVEPSSILRGIVMKVIIVSLLVRAITVSGRYERIVREFGRGRPNSNDA